MNSKEKQFKKRGLKKVGRIYLELHDVISERLRMSGKPWKEWVLETLSGAEGIILADMNKLGFKDVEIIRSPQSSQTAIIWARHPSKELTNLFGQLVNTQNAIVYTYKWGKFIRQWGISLYGERKNRSRSLSSVKWYLDHFLFSADMNSEPTQRLPSEEVILTYPDHLEQIDLAEKQKQLNYQRAAQERILGYTKDIAHYQSLVQELVGRRNDAAEDFLRTYGEAPLLEERK
jgi:hypothetical protein